MFHNCINFSSRITWFKIEKFLYIWFCISFDCSGFFFFIEIL